MFLFLFCIFFFTLPATHERRSPLPSLFPFYLFFYYFFCLTYTPFVCLIIACVVLSRTFSHTISPLYRSSLLDQRSIPYCIKVRFSFFQIIIMIIFREYYRSQLPSCSTVLLFIFWHAHYAFRFFLKFCTCCYRYEDVLTFYFFFLPSLVGIFWLNDLIFWKKKRLDHRPVGHELPACTLPRRESTAEFHPLGENSEVEYFFASDASAIIEHTNRVIFLEVT